MLKKLLLSTLIILGVIASTQAQESNDSFDFACVETEVASPTTSNLPISGSFGESSYDFATGAFIVSGQVWREIADLNIYKPAQLWGTTNITAHIDDDNFLLDTAKPNGTRRATERFSSFEELINRIEFFRPATYSSNIAQYTAVTNKLVVHDIEFVSDNDNQWSAPLATLPCNVESYIIRNDVQGVRYLQYRLVITYNDGSANTQAQAQLVDYTVDSEREQSAFTKFFYNFGSTHTPFNKNRFYSTDCPTIRLSANTSYNPLANEGRGRLIVDGFEFILRHGDRGPTSDSPAGFAISEIGVEYLSNGDFKVTHYGRNTIYATFTAAVDQIRLLRTIDPNP